MVNVQAFSKACNLVVRGRSEPCCVAKSRQKEILQVSCTQPQSRRKDSALFVCAMVTSTAAFFFLSSLPSFGKPCELETLDSQCATALQRCNYPYKDLLVDSRIGNSCTRHSSGEVGIGGRSA